LVGTAARPQDIGQVYFGFANVLRDDHRQIDAVHVDAGRLAEPRRRERLAGARRTVEQASRACGKAQADPGITPGANGVDSKTTALVRSGSLATRR
jgi:hypothetical protein